MGGGQLPPAEHEPLRKHRKVSVVHPDRVGACVVLLSRSPPWTSENGRGRPGNHHCPRQVPVAEDKPEEDNSEGFNSLWVLKVCIFIGLPSVFCLPPSGSFSHLFSPCLQSSWDAVLLIPGLMDLLAPSGSACLLSHGAGGTFAEL